MRIGLKTMRYSCDYEAAQSIKKAAHRPFRTKPCGRFPGMDNNSVHQVIKIIDNVRTHPFSPIDSIRLRTVQDLWQPTEILFLLPFRKELHGLFRSLFESAWTEDNIPHTSPQGFRSLCLVSNFQNTNFLLPNYPFSSKSIPTEPPASSKPADPSWTKATSKASVSSPRASEFVSFTPLFSYPVLFFFLCLSQFATHLTYKFMRTYQKNLITQTKD